MTPTPIRERAGADTRTDTAYCEEVVACLRYARSSEQQDEQANADNGLVAKSAALITALSGELSDYNDERSRDLATAIARAEAAEASLAEALEVVRPFAERAAEVDKVRAVAKHAHEGTTPVPLADLRRARDFHTKHGVSND